jgi:nucleoside-diphosphate-sugar epimerase
MSVLIVGCGYLGKRVATAIRDAGRPVFALTRSRTQELLAAGLTPIVGDVMRPESLALPAVETVVYAVGLDRRSGQSMRDVYVDGLANVLDRLPTPRQFVYVSSSSVYGQTDGTWVNESSPTEPIEESGRVVLEAERLLASRLPFATILRFSGIYGPNRLLRKAALLAGEPLLGNADKWLNLIHVDDGVRAVLAAEAVAGETINICDDEPVTRRHFYTTLAELLHAPAAAFAPGASTRGETNRQIANTKAKALLGFRPDFPSFRVGLPDAVGRSS